MLYAIWPYLRWIFPLVLFALVVWVSPICKKARADLFMARHYQRHIKKGTPLMTARKYAIRETQEQYGKGIISEQEGINKLEYLFGGWGSR